MIRIFTGLTALALLAACSPSGEPAAETGIVSAEALHGVMIENAETLVPSVWDTGEPAPQTALDYWHVPPTLEDIISRTECSALGEVDTWDCTLILRAPNYDAEEDERRDVEALYRMNVRINDDDSLTLIDPAVRWAVRDAE